MDRSIDSIGSCSLDVDADSTDFSDTSESLNFLTPQSQKDFTAGIAERVKHRIQQPLTPKLILQQPKQQSGGFNPITSTAYFDINSGKINTILSKSGNDYNNGNYFNGNGSEFSKQTSIEIHSPQDNSSKKPSYLNLACCVNGYSHYTSYKSREVSPNRPIIMSRQQITNDNLITVPSAPYVVRSSPFSSVTKRFAALTIQDKDSVDNASMQNKLNGSTNPEKIVNRKSFIQERVQKLYGSQDQGSPKLVSYVTRRSTDTLIDTSSYMTNGTTNGTNGSSRDEKENEENEENLNSLPVMRLLRPEFCKQLQFSSPKKTLLKSSKSNNCVTTTTVTTSQTIKTSFSETTIEQNHYNIAVSDNNAKIEIIDIDNEVPATTTVENSERKIYDQSNLESNNNCQNLKTCQTTKNINNSVTAENCKFVEDNKKMVVVNESNNSEHMANKENNCKVNNLEQNGTVESGKVLGAVKKDGHYFLDILNKERSRLLKMADDTDNELKLLQQNDSQELSEEVVGLLLSAIGKSRLLATKKMKQFEGLCYTNLNPPEGETFTTKDGDLQGFWDMMTLQVDDVDAAFAEIQKCRENGWAKPKPPSPQQPKGAKLTKRPLSQATKNRSNVPVKKSAPTNTAAQQKREEQRKKLMELKRKQKAAMSGNSPTHQNGDDLNDAEMKESIVSNKSNENDVEIFL